MPKHLLFARLFIIAVAFSLCGCSSDDNPDAPANDAGPVAVARLTPEETATAFIEAGMAGDREAIESLLTAKALEGMNSGDSGMNVNEMSYEEYTVGESELTDEGADVSIEVTENGETQTMKLKMRDEDGAYRVFAVGVVLGEGMEFTINLEEIGEMLTSMVEGFGEALEETFSSAMQSSMMGGTEEEIAEKKKRYDAIRALSNDEYESTQKNAVDYRGKTAGDALADSAEGLSLTIHGVGFESELQQEVTVSVEGLSRLQAIESICEQLGLYPVFPDMNDYMGGFGGAMVSALAEGMETMLAETLGGLPDDAQAIEAPAEPATNAIQFAKGPRPYPIAFNGPFLFEITELKENAPVPTGRIQMTVRSYGLDVGLLTLLQGLNDALLFDGLVDAQERSLIEENVFYLSSGDVTGKAYSDSYGLGLINLIREVTEIKRFSGKQKLVVPSIVEEVVFDGVEEGQTKNLGDLVLEVKGVGTHTRIEIVGPESSTENLLVQFWAEDADGASLGITFENTSRWQPGKVQAEINTQSPPHTVRLKLVTESQALEFPFSFEHIPLEKYAQTPERIEELNFGNHETPLTITLKEITDRDPSFAKVDLNIVNHSNKDVLNVSTNMEYLDASGTKLEDFPTMVTGPFTSEGTQTLVGKNGTSTQESTAFNMPEATKDILVVVQRVQFLDGTKWDEY